MANGFPTSLDILLVEDNPDHAALIERALDGGRFALTCVDTLSKAREVLKGSPPDLVLVDYKLPDGLGTELLSTSATCPMVILTSHGDESVAVQAMKTGAVDYLTKDPDVILHIERTIDKALLEWKIVTEQVAHSAEIERLHARMSSIVDAATGLAMIATDSDGRIEMFNVGAEEMLGYHPDDVVGHTSPIELHSKEEQLLLQSEFAKGGFPAVVAALVRRNDDWTYQHSDGRAIPVSIAVSHIGRSQGDSEGFLVTATDMSARVEAEETRASLERQVVQAQKLESLGLLSGGIAHDFNNILAAIIGNASLCQQQIEARCDQADIKGNIDEILLAGTRAKELVEKMLAFSRRESTDKGMSDVSNIIDDCASLVGPMVGPNVTWELDYEDDLPYAAITSVSLQQIVMNLTINASNAMKGQGELRVAARQETLLRPQRCASCQATFDGLFILIEVSDSGPGIPENLQAQIFDPFFSKQEGGSGSGLGLAVVHGVLHAVGGHIQISNQGISNDGGAVCRVFLPVSHGALDEAPDEPVQEVGPGRILVVDDDPALRKLLIAMLRIIGHEAEAADSGTAALARFASDPTAFDLVITDQSMPGMNGLELSEKLILLRPDIPIILSTGYGEVSDGEGATRYGIRKYLAKPYGREVLERTIADVLSES